MTVLNLKIKIAPVTPLWVEFLGESYRGSIGSYKEIYNHVRKRQKRSPACAFMAFIYRRQLDELAVAIAQFVQGPARRLGILDGSAVVEVVHYIDDYWSLSDIDLFVRRICRQEMYKKSQIDWPQEDVDGESQFFAHMFDEAERMLREVRAAPRLPTTNPAVHAVLVQTREVCVIWPLEMIMQHIRINYPGAKGSLFGLGE